MFKSILAAAVAAIALTAAPQSDAAVFFSIQRLSDDAARITGSGVFDIDTSEFVQLTDATSGGDTGSDPYTGSMTAGSVGLRAVYTRFGGTTNYIFEFDDSIPGGSMLSGVIRTTLDVETWAPIGTFGEVVDEASPGNVLGRYEIIDAVPLPAGALLLASGLAGIAGLRRIRR